MRSPAYGEYLDKRELRLLDMPIPNDPAAKKKMVESNNAAEKLLLAKADAVLNHRKMAATAKGLKVSQGGVIFGRGTAGWGRGVGGGGGGAGWISSGGSQAPWLYAVLPVAQTLSEHLQTPPCTCSDCWVQPQSLVGTATPELTRCTLSLPPHPPTPTPPPAVCHWHQPAEPLCACSSRCSSDNRHQHRQRRRRQ
jgi:hypothetical protein